MNGRGSIGQGISLTTLGALVFFGVCVLGGALTGIEALPGAALVAFFAIGLAQLVWVLPLLIWAYVKGRSSTAKGIWIAAAVALLLNAACFGLILSSPSGFRG